MKFILLPMMYFLMALLMAKYLSWLMYRDGNESKPSRKHEYALAFGLTVFMVVLDMLQHIGVGSP